MNLFHQTAAARSPVLEYLELSLGGTTPCEARDRLDRSASANASSLTSPCENGTESPRRN
jgi:hypothetical protein